jgi:hypothetical protein
MFTRLKGPRPPRGSRTSADVAGWAKIAIRAVSHTSICAPRGNTLKSADYYQPRALDFVAVSGNVGSNATKDRFPCGYLA